jgi:hypothetical protein
MDVHVDECKWIVVVGRIMWMNIIQYLDEHGRIWMLVNVIQFMDEDI